MAMMTVVVIGLVIVGIGYVVINRCNQPFSDWGLCPDGGKSDPLAEGKKFVESFTKHQDNAKKHVGAFNEAFKKKHGVDAQDKDRNLAQAKGKLIQPYSAAPSTLGQYKESAYCQAYPGRVGCPKTPAGKALYTRRSNLATESLSRMSYS